MNQRNQASLFSAKSSYFKPPKNVNQGHQSFTAGENHTLGESIKGYKLRGKVEGRAKKTMQQYDYVLGRFTEKFPERRDVGSIEKMEIREYLAYLMDDGLSNTSVAIHYRVLKAFFNWLVDENYISNSPINGIKEPKTPDKFPKVLDEKQVRQLVNTARNWRRTWAGYRNFTMIITFLDTGLRLNELLTAKLDDLDLDNRSIKVNGKGAKDRRVYFGKSNYTCLKHWLTIRGNLEEVFDDTIFISQNGDKLKERHVERSISRIQKEAGLEDVQVSPHVLRHTAATLAIQNGLDAFSLKRQFGWEQMRTALKYVHMSDKALQKSYRNSSPMDNLST